MLPTPTEYWENNFASWLLNPLSFWSCTFKQAWVQTAQCPGSIRRMEQVLFQPRGDLMCPLLSSCQSECLSLKFFRENQSTSGLSGNAGWPMLSWDAFTHWILRGAMCTGGHQETLLSPRESLKNSSPPLLHKRTPHNKIGFHSRYTTKWDKAIHLIDVRRAAGVHQTRFDTNL